MDKTWCKTVLSKHSTRGHTFPFRVGSPGLSCPLLCSARQPSCYDRKGLSAMTVAGASGAALLQKALPHCHRSLDAPLCKPQGERCRRYEHEPDYTPARAAARTWQNRSSEQMLNGQFLCIATIPQLFGGDNRKGDRCLSSSSRQTPQHHELRARLWFFSTPLQNSQAPVEDTLKTRSTIQLPAAGTFKRFS
jgi:hypothetical protein